MKISWFNLIFSTMQFSSEWHKAISCPIKKLESIQNKHVARIHGAIGERLVDVISSSPLVSCHTSLLMDIVSF
jgi:hypothetical protein